MSHKKFKPIKQHPNSENCLGCVAAMATSTSLRQVEKIIGKKKIYTDKDFITYLLHFNYYLGSGFKIIGDVKKQNILLNTFKLKNNPAYIVVMSERVDNTYHAIYWDGTQIYDPNSYNKDGLPLKWYTILEIYPIRKFIKGGGIEP